MNKIRGYMHTWLKRHETTRILIIVALSILCILEIRALIFDFRDAYLERRQEYLEEGANFNRGRDLTVDDIQSWMTFSYINFIFKLPSDYLRVTLSINDIRYPNLHVVRYVRMHHIDEAQFLLQLKRAISAYKS